MESRFRAHRRRGFRGTIAVSLHPQCGVWAQPGAVARSVASTTAPQLKKTNSMPSDSAMDRASTVLPQPCGPSSRMFWPLSSRIWSFFETIGSTSSGLEGPSKALVLLPARRGGEGRLAARTESKAWGVLSASVAFARSRLLPGPPSARRREAPVRAPMIGPGRRHAQSTRR